MDTENNRNIPTRVLISGGGTGGHIFPALSIAAALRRRFPKVDIRFVGAENRMEMERVPAAGYPIEGLPVCGFDRKRPWRNIRTLWLLWKSMRRARRIVRDFRPDIAVGVGGYASGPTLKAAQRAGVPTLLQEQNSYPGVTNKLLGRRARRICTAYDRMDRFFPSEAIVLTGNPVRADLLRNSMTPALAKEILGFDPNRPLVLVVGGSLGARTINEAILAGIRDGRLGTGNGVQVLWQTGKSHADKALAAMEQLNPKDIKAQAFISNMDVAYRAADLVVARAGAGTISELQLLGKPAILVPSPNVAEDHQRKNALALVDRDAAIMVEDADAADDLVDTMLATVADTARCRDLSTNIAAMALADSDEKIVDAIVEILNEKITRK